MKGIYCDIISHTLLWRMLPLLSLDLGQVHMVPVRELYSKAFALLVCHIVCNLHIREAEHVSLDICTCVHTENPVSSLYYLL
jgi:hypothetical protein